MSIIPLDLQRRFEQRWSARFSRPPPPAAPKKHRLESQRQQFSPRPAKAKEKPAGLSRREGVNTLLGRRALVAL